VFVLEIVMVVVCGMHAKACWLCATATDDVLPLHGVKVPVNPAAVHAVSAAAGVSPISFGTTRLVAAVHAVTSTATELLSPVSGVTPVAVAEAVVVRVPAVEYGTS